MPVGGLVPMPPASNDDGSVIGTPVAGTTTSNAIPDRSRLLPHVSVRHGVLVDKALLTDAFRTGDYDISMGYP